jgi:hypothetical protein
MVKKGQKCQVPIPTTLNLLQCKLEHDVIYLNEHNHKFSYDDNLDIGFAACLGFRD